METFAIAVKAGKFQAQFISYKKNGASVVRPVSDWIKYREACAFAPADWKPAYRFLDPQG